MEPRVAQALRRAAQYLLGRQCADGGFCFYRSEHLEEPNLGDTYHAVSALKLLDHAVPREPDIVAFVDRFPQSEQPHHLYYLSHTRRAIEPTYRPADWIVRSVRALQVTPPPSPSRVSGWLERTRLVVRLKREFAEAPDADATRRLLESLKDDGGFGSRPNLHDTWFALEILDACGDACAWPESAAFIDRLQCEPFGFTDTLVGTKANVDVVYAGVRSCALLDLPVRYPDHALRFLLHCQTGNGGFARAPDALPSIEYTHAAMAALLRLAQPRAADH
jgi:hypothetical protein